MHVGGGIQNLTDIVRESAHTFENGPGVLAVQNDAEVLMQLLKELHPSPAVGGSPRSAACQRIRHYENFDRGLYAGPIGWVNSSFEGEFLVGIRSALVDEDIALLYAGVGIVKGSVPENEAVETDLKFKALLESLL